MKFEDSVISHADEFLSTEALNKLIREKNVSPKDLARLTGLSTVTILMATNTKYDPKTDWGVWDFQKMLIFLALTNWDSLFVEGNSNAS